MGRSLRKELRRPRRILVGCRMCIPPASSQSAPCRCTYDYSVISRIRRHASTHVQYHNINGSQAQRPDYRARNLHQFRWHGYRGVLLPAIARIELQHCARHLRLSTDPSRIRSPLWLSRGAPWLHAIDPDRRSPASFLATLGGRGRFHFQYTSARSRGNRT